MPFFKTVTIFFVLYGDSAKPNSVVYCIIKCLPILSLIIFVLLNSVTYSKPYSYSHKILYGLMCSCVGDAFLVWKEECFLHGVGIFAVAHVFYASAFGFRPLGTSSGIIFSSLAAVGYWYVLPGLTGILFPLGTLYFMLIFMMVWCAVARVKHTKGGCGWPEMSGCIGALLFIVSDFVLALNLFYQDIPYSHPIVMVTYYAAQLGISLSIIDNRTNTKQDKVPKASE